MSTSGDSVEVELRVGMLDFALAKLMSSEHHTIEFPTLLLPENVVAGSIIKLQCSRAAGAEIEDRGQFEKVQQDILDTFATNLPQVPVLRARNITQTSAVLEWDNIDIATADLHFMALYKGDQRLGFIPQPLKRTVTKVSNLEIDAPYKFRLVLSTSAGTFESNELEIRTHKMTNLTGVVTCLGSLAHSSISESEIRETLARLGCKEPQDTVKLDTTHFICSTEGGPAFSKALELNIPIVRPEWLKACESERRLASVRGFYLSVDPPVPKPVADSHKTHNDRQAGATVGVAETNGHGGTGGHGESRTTEPAENTETTENTEDSGAENSGATESILPPTEESEQLSGSKTDRHSSDGSDTHHRSASADIPGPVVPTNGYDQLAPHDRSSVKSVKSLDIGSDTNEEYIVGSELSREVTADPDAQLKDSEEQKVVVQVPDMPEPQCADVLTERKRDFTAEPEAKDIVEGMDAVTEAVREEDIEVHSEAAEQIVDDTETGANTETGADTEIGDAGSKAAGIHAEPQPTGDEPAKDEPAKDEPAKDEPAKDEPAKDEPNKNERIKTTDMSSEPESTKAPESAPAKSEIESEIEPEKAEPPKAESESTKHAETTESKPETQSDSTKSSSAKKKKKNKRK